MSIVVNNVSKVFGRQHALSGVSLTLERGEVVGLLGPNGAGKSTLMRLITGFFPPTEGRIEVCGFDVMDSPLETKRRVGYLPERNPVHEDMYVRALIRRLGQDRTVILSTHIMQEVEAMCDRVVLIRLGDIVADGPLSEFVAAEGGLEAQFKALTA